MTKPKTYTIDYYFSSGATIHQTGVDEDSFKRTSKALENENGVIIADGRDTNRTQLIPVRNIAFVQFTEE